MLSLMFYLRFLHQKRVNHIKEIVNYGQKGLKFYSKYGTEKISVVEFNVISINQAPNRSEIWSQKQIPKSIAMGGPRFEAINIINQPNPAAAIELISKFPIIKIEENIVACDGGGRQSGHPKIFLNLVTPF